MSFFLQVLLTITILVMKKIYLTKFWCFRLLKFRIGISLKRQFVMIWFNGNSCIKQLFFLVFFLYTLQYMISSTEKYFNLGCFSSFILWSLNFSLHWALCNILALSTKICLVLIVFWLFVIYWLLWAKITLKWQVNLQECGECVANVRIYYCLLIISNGDAICQRTWELININFTLYFWSTE